MNVYQVRTDHEDRLVIANTFMGAIEADYQIFLKENEGEDYANREYYEDLIEQVLCIGELGE